MTLTKQCADWLQTRAPLLQLLPIGILVQHDMPLLCRGDLLLFGACVIGTPTHCQSIRPQKDPKSRRRCDQNGKTQFYSRFFETSVWCARWQDPGMLMSWRYVQKNRILRSRNVITSAPNPSNPSFGVASEHSNPGPLSHTLPHHTWNRICIWFNWCNFCVHVNISL